MAYERTNWQNGDVISSEKLNKMEAGIEYACSLEHEVEDPTEGQVLKYDSEKEKFVNADVPAAIETNIQNPTDGQTLKYDATNGKWVNGEGGSGSSRLTVNVTTDQTTSVSTLDKTWQEIADAFPNVAFKAVNPNDQTQFALYPSYRIEAYNGYKVYSTNGNTDITYTADSPDDYPRIGVS